MSTTPTSYHVDHVAVVDRRRDFRLILAFQGFEHPHCRTMHVTGQEGYTYPLRFCNQLQLFYEPITFRLHDDEICRHG